MGYIYVIWKGGNFQNTDFHIKINGETVATYNANMMFADKFDMPSDISNFTLEIDNPFVKCKRNLSNVDPNKGYLCSIEPKKQPSGGTTYTIIAREDNITETKKKLNVLIEKTSSFPVKLIFNEKEYDFRLDRKYSGCIFSYSELNFPYRITLKHFHSKIVIFDETFNEKDLDMSKDYILHIKINLNGAVSYSFLPGSWKLLFEKNTSKKNNAQEKKDNNTKESKITKIATLLAIGFFAIVGLVALFSVTNKEKEKVERQKSIERQREWEEQRRINEEIQQNNSYRESYEMSSSNIRRLQGYYICESNGTRYCLEILSSGGANLSSKQQRNISCGKMYVISSDEFEFGNTTVKIVYGGLYISGYGKFIKL